MSDRWQLDAATVERLYRTTRGAEWTLDLERFAAALDRSARKYFGDETPAPRELDRYLDSLHAGDMACACACADDRKRRGITSFASIDPRCIARRTRSTPAVARASSQTPSTASSSASRCARA